MGVPVFSSRGFCRTFFVGLRHGTIKDMLSREQQQAVIEGRPIEIHEDDQVFYVISKEQFELWQQLQSTVEEIDPSFYEADDIKFESSSMGST